MTVVTNNPRWNTVISQQLLDVKAKQLAMRLEDINAHTTEEWQRLEERKSQLERWRSGHYLFHAGKEEFWSAA
jgi:hypothetical protein